MQIESIDHIVLTVRDFTRTCEFYEGVLGMRVERFDAGRLALRFGAQKINLHQAGKEFEPKALVPTPGSADICFVTRTRPAQIVEAIRSSGHEIVEGPVPRTGALGSMTSVYVRDPDGNLIEIACYDGG